MPLILVQISTCQSKHAAGRRYSTLNIETVLPFATFQFEFEFKSDGTSERADLGDPDRNVYEHISTGKSLRREV